MPTQRKARAYTFHNRLVTNDRDQTRRAQQITRVADSEVIDGITSANIDMLTAGGDAGQQPNIPDFNLSFKRDIILRKFLLFSPLFNLNSKLQLLTLTSNRYFYRNACKRPNSF